MVSSLQQNSEHPLKRIFPKPRSLHNFVTTSLLQFFKILQLDEPRTWRERVVQPRTLQTEFVIPIRVAQSK